MTWKPFAIAIVCLTTLFVMAHNTHAQDKITGPWLWMIAPTEPDQGGAASIDIDSLAVASDGAIQQPYPWGNTVPDGKQCNFADKHLAHFWWADEKADDGYAYTAPAENYPENEYGLYAMAGNVSEWCLDEYDASFYGVSPDANPVSGIATLEGIMETFSSVQSSRVLRGGSWLVNSQAVRNAVRFRLHPSRLSSSVGFRCAKDVPF